MKKIICYMVCVIMLLALVSCDNAENQSTNPPIAIEKENQFEFSASSLQDYVEKMSGSGTQMQSLSQNSLFVQAANNDQLSFDVYDVSIVYYRPGQTDGGDWNGNISLNVYWHDANDCPSCYFNHCAKFRLHLIYFRDGVDQGGATKGYTQTNEKNFYTKKINNNQTAYVYLIDNQYYCRYVINNELEDHDAVADQLKNFCREIQSSLKNDATVK